MWEGNTLGIDLQVAVEIEILSRLADTLGFVKLLSWTERTFEVRLVFPVYPFNLSTYMCAQHRGPDRAGVIRVVSKQLLDALAHLHDAQIIHGDLKPGNILVDDAAGSASESPAFGGISVVLADFGGGQSQSMHRFCHLNLSPRPGAIA